jgi:hypothetical protein
MFAREGLIACVIIESASVEDERAQATDQLHAPPTHSALQREPPRSWNDKMTKSGRNNRTCLTKLSGSLDIANYFDGGTGNDTMRGGNTTDYIADMTGGDDIMYGGGRADVLDDFYGHSQLFGEGGDDFIAAAGGSVYSMAAPTTTTSPLRTAIIR